MTTTSRFVGAAIFTKPVLKFIPTQNLNTTTRVLSFRVEGYCTWSRFGSIWLAVGPDVNLPPKRYPYSLSAKHCGMAFVVILSRQLESAKWRRQEEILELIDKVDKRGVNGILSGYCLLIYCPSALLWHHMTIPEPAKREANDPCLPMDWDYIIILC